MGVVKNSGKCGLRIHTDKQPDKTKYCEHDQREAIGCLVSVAGQRLGADKYQNLREEQVAGTRMPITNTNGGPANRLEDNDFVHLICPCKL